MLTRVVALILIGTAATLSGCAQRHVDFGDPMKLPNDQTRALSNVLTHPDDYEDEYIRVSGKVTKVCAKKGCWLEMDDGHGSQPVFVKFVCPVEGRLIPMDAVGHSVVVEGQFLLEEISQDDARHYAEDGGASPEEIERIKGPQKKFRMSSPSARVIGITRDDLPAE
jgi:uncharacterized protein DUF4920